MQNLRHLLSDPGNMQHFHGYLHHFLNQHRVVDHLSHNGRNHHNLLDYFLDLVDHRDLDDLLYRAIDEGSHVVHDHVVDVDRHWNLLDYLHWNLDVDWNWVEDLVAHREGLRHPVRH